MYEVTEAYEKVMGLIEDDIDGLQEYVNQANWESIIKLCRSIIEHATTLQTWDKERDTI